MFFKYPCCNKCSYTSKEKSYQRNKMFDVKRYKELCKERYDTGGSSRKQSVQPLPCNGGYCHGKELRYRV